MLAGWIGMLRVRRRGAWSAEIRGINLTPRSDRARCSSELCWSSSDSDSALSCLVAWPCAWGFLFLTTRYRGILKCYGRQVVLETVAVCEIPGNNWGEAMALQVPERGSLAWPKLKLKPGQGSPAW